MKYQITAERINKSKKMIDICKKILAGEIEEYGLMKKVFLPKRIKLYERHLESLYKEIKSKETDCYGCATMRHTCEHDK